MCACVYIYTHTYTLLYKGKINSKMLRQEGVTQSQKRKEKKSVKAMFDTRFFMLLRLYGFCQKKERSLSKWET